MRDYREPVVHKKTNGLNIACVVLMVALICVVLFAAVGVVGFVVFYQPSPHVGTGKRATPAPSIAATAPRVATQAALAPTWTATVPPPSPTSTPAPTDTATPAAPPATAQPADLNPPAVTRAETPAPRRKAAQGLHMNSPEYGMQAFLWWRAETADRDLRLIDEAGFTWVKQICGWRDIEGAGKNQFDWERPDRIIQQVEAHGLNLIARIDNQPAWAGGGFPGIGAPDNLQDYADFVYAFASRYKGRVRAYQIWNEPNLAREWGEKAPDPAGYTAMLKAAYGAVKRADPQAMVISAGMAPTSRSDHVAMPDVDFIRGMYQAGAKPFFDVLGAHGAGFKVPPETDPAQVANDPALYNGDPSPAERRRIYCFRHTEDLRQVMVESGDADKQVALLEFGWTSDSRPDSPYHWHAVTEKEKADYFVRAYQYAKQHWAPWVGVMSLIYMPYPEWKEDDEKWWWAIIDPKYPELQMRPAYAELKTMPK